MRKEPIRREKTPKIFNLINRTSIFCQEKNNPVYVRCEPNKILFEISATYSSQKRKRPFRHGTMPLIRIASSGHSSSHFRQPKQTSSLTISSKPLWTLKQRTGQISAQAPQALQWSRISMVGFIVISDFACLPVGRECRFLHLQSKHMKLEFHHIKFFDPFQSFHAGEGFSFSSSS